MSYIQSLQLKIEKGGNMPIRPVLFQGKERALNRSEASTLFPISSLVLDVQQHHTILLQHQFALFLHSFFGAIVVIHSLVCACIVRTILPIASAFHRYRTTPYHICDRLSKIDHTSKYILRPQIAKREKSNTLRPPRTHQEMSWWLQTMR